MRSFLILPFIVMSAALSSCQSDHLITDRTYMGKVLDDFDARKVMYESRRPDLFSLPEQAVGIAKEEALRFLLAYMPLNDIACYDPGLLKENVNLALLTRVETAWGKEIPYDVFLHFVLPQRVNNENLDSFRLVYYDEIMNRISDLDAYEAALEINHWCHEKVSYQPSDIRTSAPMSTILSARGRCGEESTLAVAALRTAGIPARQVYTPRWAHSDDNHAWVEVWINGGWYYLGACEPEPVLDRGWFTEPAKRAMLVHTKAFGRYYGTEPVIRHEKYFSEINALDKYAATRELVVTVTDESGEKVFGADVNFLLYNYAEFYPLASLKTNADGICKFRTGKGSIIVWASKNSLYSFKNITPDDCDTVALTITANHPDDYIPLDLFAPVPGKPLPPPSEELIRENAKRLKSEDSIRQAYIDSWMSGFSVEKLSADLKLDSLKLSGVIKSSMGNYRNIIAFLNESQDKPDLALRLLDVISEKDMRDTRPEVLSDHIRNAPAMNETYDGQFYDNYVLSPRVDNEILTPFRSYLSSAFPEELRAGFIKDPASIASWVDSSVVITESENYYNTPIPPACVVKMRIADAHSRDILMVALCRTFGHAARLEPGTGRPQFFCEGWHDVWFKESVRPSEVKSFVTFTSSEKNPVPEYHIHFSLARFENGMYRTLDFGYNVRINDLPANIPLDPGKYMLVTGNRDGEGNVLASVRFFDLLPGTENLTEVNLRHPEEQLKSSGRVDLDGEIITLDGEKLSMKKLSERGIVISWIEPDREPTKHILRDLAQMKREFDNWGGCFLFLLDEETTTDSFRPAEIHGLPENTVFARDDGKIFLRSLFPSDSNLPGMPVVICADNRGKIGFSSSGYRIGIGEQILKNIK